ncbi:MAG: ATP-binding protein [Dehalococcoidia bacterium]|nr:ATP-binding protein [Dehalococcoidia bacterium]
MPDSKTRAREAVLFLLSGLPGTGKTTFARALGAATGALHLESDAVRRELFPEPRYEPPEHARVFGAIHARAATALSAGRNVIVDATNLFERDRRRFVRLADRGAADMVAVRLVAPEATVRERLSRPRDGWSQADEAVFDLMRRRPQPFNVPVVVIDSRYPTAASVALVLALLERDDA